VVVRFLPSPLLCFVSGPFGALPMKW